MIKALMALIACQLIGEICVRITHAPIPGPVAGLVLLLIILLVRRNVPDDLEKTSQGLLANLSMMFIPAGVGIVEHLHTLAAEVVPIAVSILVSTILGIVVTGLVFKLVHQWSAGYVADDVEDPSA